MQGIRESTMTTDISPCPSLSLVPTLPHGPKKMLLDPIFSTSTKPSSTRPWFTSLILRGRKGRREGGREVSETICDSQR